MNKYTIRHRTLQALYDWKEESRASHRKQGGTEQDLQNIETLYVPLSKMLELVGVDDKSFRQANVRLVHDEEMKYINHEGEEHVRLSSNSFSSLFDRKYPGERWNKWKEGIDYFVRWIIPISAMSISTYLALKSINSTNILQEKVLDNNKQIQTLKQQVDMLKLYYKK